MVALFVVIAALFASIGVGLLGLGVSMAIHGEPAAGGLSAVVGALTLYGAYLFGRAGLRIRRDLARQPLSPERRAERRAHVRAVLGFAGIVAAAGIVMPVPNPVRVLGAIGAVLAVPLILVVDFEPRKRRD